MAAAIQVKGIAELNKAVTSIGFDFSELSEANLAIAKTVADRAATLAPRRTGALAGSIKGVRDKNKVRVSAGNANVPYAGVIEYGWAKRRIKAQPYITKAAAELRDEIKQRYENNIKDIIRKNGLN